MKDEEKEKTMKGTSVKLFIGSSHMSIHIKIFIHINLLFLFYKDIQ